MPARPHPEHKVREVVLVPTAAAAAATTAVFRGWTWRDRVENDARVPDGTTWPLVRRKMASAPLVLESSAILPKKVMKDEASPSI